MKNLIHWEYLYSADSSTIWKNKGMTSGAAEYSKGVRVHISTGYAALLVLLTGGVDDVDITFEVSLDDINYYTPKDVDDNDLGIVYTTLTASRWITFSPQVAEYIRFKFDPDANSTVTAVYIQQEI